MPDDEPEDLSTRRVADDADVRSAVAQITSSFNKPDEEKKKFTTAVEDIVSGQLTIKEGSIKYGFATSTLHPYVHKTRHLLGDVAPALKNQTSTKVTPKCVLEAMEREKKKQSSPENGNGVAAAADIQQPEAAAADASGSSAAGDADEGDMNGIVAAGMEFLSMFDPAVLAAAAAAALAAREGNGDGGMDAEAQQSDWPSLDDDDDNALHIDEAAPLAEDKPKYESVEDAAREAIDASALVDDSQSIVMFMAVVKCLNNELDYAQAATNYGLEVDVIEQVVDDAAKLLGISTPTTKVAANKNRRSGLPSLMTIEESVRRIISVSHYTGDNKDRLFTAVFNTVKGQLPLTQAAAAYSIPFSTLHPYVKKVRQDLGLSMQSPQQQQHTTPANSSKFTASQHLLSRAKQLQNTAVKRPALSTTTASTSAKKVRRQPFTGPGAAHISPFKPVRIPDSWKQNPKAMEASVREAVKSCQYEDASKKKRLACAVYEAVSGRKTMKMAAVENNVPFTTLQTYFHRTRVALAKMFGDDPCATVTSNGDAKAADSSSILDSLAQTANQSNSNNNDETKSNSSSSGGSNRRKPAKTYKHGISSCSQSPVHQNDNSNMENPFMNEDFDTKPLNGEGSDDWPDMLDDEDRANDSMDWLGEDEQPLPVASDDGGKDNDEDTRPLPDGYTFEMVVQQAIRNTHYAGEHKQAMIQALIVAVSGQMSLREAAKLHNTQINALHNYYNRAKQMCKAMRNGDDPQTVLSMTASEASAKARRNKDVANGLLSDLDTNNMPIEQLLDESVKRVIRTSLYPPEQKERLRQAVEKVISGELTINAAANQHQLPSSTVHPYVHRARALLGDRCPPQAQGPTPLQTTSAASSTDSKTGLGTPLPLPQHEAPSMVPHSSVMPLISDDKATPDADNKLSAKATLRAVRHLGPDFGSTSPGVSSSPKPGTSGIDAEQAEKTIGELVKNSLYDSAGRKRLFDAVLSVVLERMNTSEAARANQVPPSTIQPYVQKTRVAMGIPIMGLAPPNGKNRHNQYTVNRSLNLAAGGSAVRRPAFEQQEYAKPGEEADDEEIQGVVDDVTKTCSLVGDRKVALWNAVFDAVSGRCTIKEASVKHELCGSTVHPYVSRARVRLGSKCPQPKLPATGNQFTVRQAAAVAAANSSPVAAADADKKPAIAEPIPCDVEDLDNDLEKELHGIISKYNYRGDMKKLVQAIAMVLGDRRTLLEVSTQTDIAQTTLSTYVRIAKLFLKESFLTEYQKAKQAEEGTGEPEQDALPEQPEPSGAGHKDSGTDKSHDAAKPETRAAKADAKLPPSNVVLTTATELADYTEYLESLCAGAGGGEEADERRIKAVCSYLVKMQYRRSADAQQQLIDAAEDVMLNGLSAEEAHKCHAGVSLHVLNIYLSRIRQATDLFAQPMQKLIKCARDIDSALCDPDNEPESSKASGRRSSGKVPTTAAGVSPVRTSRRLQQKQEEAKRQAKYDHVFMPQRLLSKFTAYIHKLESANFPVPERFVIGCAQQTLKQNDQLRGYAELTEDRWKEWYQDTFATTKTAVKKRSL